MATDESCNIGENNELNDLRPNLPHAIKLIEKADLEKGIQVKAEMDISVTSPNKPVAEHDILLSIT